MPVHVTTRDPRSIVTPDAFEVSEELLGYPLASPSRRLIALLIDVVVIGLITAMTNSFALVLGVVAAIVFIRAGFKRTPVKGSVFGRAMRLSVGCFGLFIALVTTVTWSIFGIGFGSDDDGRDFSIPTVTADGRINDVGGTLGDLVNLGGGGLALQRADNEAAAESAMRVLAQAGRDVGLTRAEIREGVLEAVPEDRDWTGSAPEMLERILDEVTGSSGEAPAVTPVMEDLSSLSTEEALQAYLAVFDSEEEDAEARRTALRGRLLGDIAAHTLRALERGLADWRDEAQRTQGQLQTAQQNLDAATSGGLFAWLRRFVDELGFGFGWASLYLTVILSWWNGQTVGKRVMKIRVMRLDGEPVNWWIAFERAGGYAAGFATGLLGFAQVYWDANRQAIHDRIVGTVVVMDGAEKVVDWQEAL
jgi:uncharacterized RDD family membrane protein YckC